MAYLGLYKDNLPFICAAGRKSGRNYTAGECLREYTLEDKIHALKTDLYIKDKEYVPVKLPKLDAIGRSPGIYTESRDLLNPTPLTRYRQLITDLKETTYDSFWNKKLGAVPDAYASFPVGFKVEETTFGDPYIYHTTMKDLINPPKKPTQVLWESQINHEAYKKIYGDYNPAERVERGYKSPPFNPNMAFGQPCGYDKRGLKAKCCMEWYNTSPVTIASKIQGDSLERNKSKLGKCHEPNKKDILSKLPKDPRLGKPYKRYKYGMEDLLRDVSNEIPQILKDMRPWLRAFNRLKMAIETRISPIFDYNSLSEEMFAYDTDGSGLIPFGSLLQVMRCNEILFNIEHVKALMEFLGIVVGGRVDYQKFLDSLKGHLDLSKLRIPGYTFKPFTIYQASYCDTDPIRPHNNCCGQDFKSSTRNVGDERSYLEKYAGYCDYTDAKTCLEPTIFTQYGLSHRDFFCPRDKVLLRSIFQKIGYDLSDEHFDKLWEMGKKIDDSDMVCVQTFRDLLDKYFPMVITFTNIDGTK